MAINNYSDQDFQRLQQQVTTQGNQINNLQESLNNTNDDVHDLSTTVDTYVQKTDNLQITVAELTEKVNQLTTRVNQIRNELDTVIYPKLQNHEDRITVLENSKLVYTKTRKVLNPRYESTYRGTVLYMPKDLTKHDFEICNEDIAGKIYFGWFQKIFNPHGYGRVFFDFKTGKDGELQGLTIGQHARIIIPMGVKIKYQHEKTALLHTVYTSLAVKEGLLSNIMVSEYTGEVLVVLVNLSPGLVYIGANDPLITLIHTFTYNTKPEQLTEEQFNQF